jgi:hypothetical protein
METTEEKKKSFSAQYSELLVKYPLLVNAVQGAIIAGLGVLASQVLSGMENFDYTEVWIMMLINFAYHPPVLMWFNSILRKSNMKIIPLLIADQAFFSPFFTAGIVSIRLLLLGTELRAIPGIVLDVVPKAMGPSWLFWVPSKAIIFLYVPPMYQLLAGNAFAFVWTIIFAMILQAK